MKGYLNVSEVRGVKHVCELCMLIKCIASIENHLFFKTGIYRISVALDLWTITTADDCSKLHNQDDTFN